MQSKVVKIVAIVAMVVMPYMAHGQIYAKLNTLYACVGIINPQLEFIVGPHSSVVIDPIYSPWKSVKGKHFNFGILQNEYRFYIKREAKGFYVSANAGMQLFDMTRPFLLNKVGGKRKFITWEQGFGRGFGVMVGLGVGYTHRFKERWVLDAYVAFDRMWSWYNDYDAKGQINMYPAHQKEPPYPDPFNGSAEWLPSKIGFSIGYMIFDPNKSIKKGIKKAIGKKAVGL